MGSQIESGLKKAKSHKLQYISRENLNFDGPGHPKTCLKTGPKLVPNLIFDAEALEKPLESLSVASWTLLERSWSALGRSYSALGAENTPT